MGENSKDVYAVLLEPSADVETSRIARAMAPALGKATMDLMMALRNRSGILAESLSEEEAGRIAAGLQQAGVLFFIVKQNSLVDPPPVVEIREGRFTDEGYAFESRPQQVLAPWDRILLLECARVRYEVSKVRTELDVSFDTDGEGNTLRNWQGRQKRVQEPAWKVLLEVICEDPWVRVRIDGSSYRFGKDGLPVHLNRHDNLLARAVVLRTRSERAAAGPGLEALLGGRPDAQVKLNGMECYENHIRWQLQMIYRQG